MTKPIFFPFYPNCHHNSSSLSLSLSHSCTSIYCNECVSLLLFSSFCFFSSLLFSSLSFFFPLESACCLILWARFANGIRQTNKKTSACLLLVTASSVQNTSDNTNDNIQKGKLKKILIYYSAHFLINVNCAMSQ